MMSLMVPPVAPAGQLADALALLRVASDPEPARARLEEIAAAQTRLAEADAQLTAKMADLDGREKTVAARDALRALLGSEKAQ